MIVCKLELTEAERVFLLHVFEVGMAHMGVASLCAKLRATAQPAPAPAPVEEPAPAVEAAPTLDPVA